jgi:hypothetical protein
VQITSKPSWIRCLLLLLLASFPGGLCLDSLHAENYLEDYRITIQRHDKRNSSVRFKDALVSKDSILWGLLFDSSIWQSPSAEEARVVDYEALPQCRESKVTLYELQTAAESFGKNQDIIYYNEKDRNQVSLAKNFPGIAVAYQAALIRDPQTNDLPLAQVFARFIRVQCLPTRFRFSEIGSKRYAEFRTGSEAWKGD